MKNTKTSTTMCLFFIFILLGCKENTMSVSNEEKGILNTDIEIDSPPIEAFLEIKHFDASQFDLANVFFPENIQTSEDLIKRREILGYIGDHYQRFEIHFTSCKKSQQDSLTYELAGKTRVRNTICNFKGTLKITSVEFEPDSIRILDKMEAEKDKRPIAIISKLILFEDKAEKHSGKFEGTLITKAYIQSNKSIHYNAFEFHSDGYKNNQFEGTWKSYSNNEQKKCNWGDYRIPNSSELDQGAGEFSPNSKYYPNGWDYYRDIYSENKKLAELARKIEEKEWWKKNQ